MSCKIKDFKEQWYRDKSNNLNEEWLEYEMIRLNIATRDRDLLKRIRENLSREKDINALQLAKGDPGTSPEEPTLKLVEDKKEEEKATSNEEVDFRASKIKTVTKGTKIAEFVFKSEGINGCDIYGDEVPYPPPELPEVELIGKGVQKGHHYDFYAATDGLAKVDVEAKTIEVSKTYLVEGDVSLVTGNIVFDGSVHITGGVRDKSSVTATKDITIEGGVANATLKCEGNLEVGLGIVKSTINCKNELKAGFIENSTLRVGKVLRSSRGLVNCQVVTENIEVKGDPGLIGGGSIFCQGKMFTDNLGFEADHPTTVTMGVSWNTARAISINENRVTHFKSALEETEKSLAMFMKKSKAQTTKAQEEMKEGFHLKIKKLKEILKKLEKRLKSLKIANSDCNQNSQIRVANNLRANVKIMMGSKRVKSLSDCTSVYVNFVAKRGSNIQAIPEEELTGAQGAGTAENKENKENKEEKEEQKAS